MTDAPLPRHRDGGWSAPVAVPERLADLHGPSTGRLQLPTRIYSSADGPHRVWNLDDPRARDEFYAVVMENAALRDVLELLNESVLRATWSTLHLSPHVRRAWAPLLDTATAT